VVRENPAMESIELSRQGLALLKSHFSALFDDADNIPEYLQIVRNTRLTLLPINLGRGGVAGCQIEHK
jgi:hypothetical protein